jgi:hypothetical protein
MGRRNGSIEAPLRGEKNGRRGRASARGAVLSVGSRVRSGSAWRSVSRAARGWAGVSASWRRSALGAGASGLRSGSWRSWRRRAGKGEEVGGRVGPARD